MPRSGPRSEKQMEHLRKLWESSRGNSYAKGYKKTPEQIENHRRAVIGKTKGSKNGNWKGGRTHEERNWIKNKRNRVIKRIQKSGLGHTFGEWENLKAQYGYKCACCGKSEPNIKLTEDHIIPLSKGGSDLIENIQPLCLPCNLKKHTLIIKY